MKKVFSVILCLFLTLAILSPSAHLPKTPGVEATGAASPLAESYVGADFRGGEIAYELDSAIDCSINTFEACIRIDSNAYTKANKSIIFGNYNSNNACSTNNRYVNFEINASGNVSVGWTGTDYVFTDVDVRTGEWLHLAVVRDVEKGVMHLYVNGALMQTLGKCPTTELTGNFFRHRIGGDCIEGVKNPFWGEIGHIACYSTPRTQEQIQSDYSDVTKVSCFTAGNDLLFASMLSLGVEIVADASAHFNTARLITNDYFYDAQLYPVGDYSIAALGDTQRIAQFGAQSCVDISQWLIDNVDTRKIGMSVYLGDMTGQYVGTDMKEWDRMLTVIRNATSLLDGKVPYMVIPGNHDYNENSGFRDLNKFNEYFEFNRLATSFNGFAGAYEVGQTQNTYYTKTLGGVDYLFIALEFGPEPEVMEWVCDVLDAHPNHRAIVSTHGFLNTAGSLYAEDEYLSADQYWSIYDGDAEVISAGEMWEKYLSNHDNLFMILCGHSTTESVAYKALRGKNGNTTMVFRLDPSFILDGFGMDSIIGLFQFHEATSTVTLNYFSALKQELYNVQNQMTVNFADFTRLTHSYYTHGGIER